jgi:Ni/Co efflux regulator RcnB
MLMKRFFLLVLLAAFTLPVLAQNDTGITVDKADKVLSEKDKYSADKDRAKNHDKQHNKKGKGKPANPGAHGRANAERKKAGNPGKGGGKNKKHADVIKADAYTTDGKETKKKGEKDAKKDR